MSDNKDPLAALLAAKIAEDPEYLQKILAMAVARPQADASKDCAPPIQSGSTKKTRGRSRTREKSPKRTLSTASTEIIDDDDEVILVSKRGKSPVRSRKDASSQSTKAYTPSRGRAQAQSTLTRKKPPCSDSCEDDQERSRDRSPDSRKHRRKSPDDRESRRGPHSRSLSPDRQKSRQKSPDRKIMHRKSRSLSPLDSGSSDRQQSRQPPASNRKVTRRKSRSLSPSGSGSSSRSSDPRRSRSQSPGQPLYSVDPKSIPKPPKGWMDDDYYDRMYTS
ncbi:hypothetical protein FRC11_003333, partial [Ceratobasidium sp. 423]